MPTIRYCLIPTAVQRANKVREAQLFLRYSHRSKMVHFYTKKIIPLDCWDKRNQRVKRNYPGYLSTNVYLSKYSQRVEDIVNTAFIEEVDPTVSFVKDQFNGRYKSKTVLESLTFWDFVDKFMDKAAKRLTKNTNKSYRTSFKNLKKFEKHAKMKLDWQNIDMDFYYDYQDYYLNFLDLKMNGFGKIIKLLKTVLNEATDQGYNTNKTYKSKNFKVLKEDVDNIYLNELELKILLDLDLSDDKKLEKVRDLFIVGCYTGVRFSDLGQLNHQNIKGEMIYIKAQKTGKDLVIPILGETRAIIDKYDGYLPKPFTNQVMNRYLKELGELAGIDGDFNTYNNKGTERLKHIHKKWEMISTHTARRSFATNMYLRGWPSIQIMSITGHSSEKVFMTYIKVSQEENARLILELSKNH
ncbi:site-specific integrase [Gillisia sp. JM1]|uniref:site-specific integrase n=1 Tax=Gillisia sp. JM1 TaxID=1283286 RepID=UPI00040F7EAE|nr:site-specific integrase [Gillisia sp. JM1]